MKATPFDPSRDLAPIPFSASLCRKARELKVAGLLWEPQVGCFVWDPEQTIPAPSPFGERIYFVLNLNRFLQFYQDLDELREKLVWLPTWHQARQLLLRLGVENAATAGSPEEEFLDLYERIQDALRSRNA
jgi:hypothetical protein